MDNGLICRVHHVLPVLYPRPAVMTCVQVGVSLSFNIIFLFWFLYRGGSAITLLVFHNFCWSSIILAI